MRGFSQTFHFWKENRRASSLPLRAHVTYIRLPWHAIVNGQCAGDVGSNLVQRKPVGGLTRA